MTPLSTATLLLTVMVWDRMLAYGVYGLSIRSAPKAKAEDAQTKSWTGGKEMIIDQGLGRPLGAWLDGANHNRHSSFGYDHCDSEETTHLQQEKSFLHV